MKQTHSCGMLDLIAKSNGYDNKLELFRDYGLSPSVVTPKHKKIEFIALLWKHLGNRKKERIQNGIL